MISLPKIGSDSALPTDNVESQSVHSEFVKDVVSMDFIVHEPIRSGFLLKFCNAQFCSENMRFIVEVDRFRDLFHVDKSCWPRKHWKELDEDMQLITPEMEEFDAERDFLTPVRDGTFFDAAQWPSRRLPMETVTQAILHIWTQFMANDAPYWICMQSKCLMNTIKRLRLLHLYGREVFCEAMLDPIKTIQRDIQPRFLASEDYRSLKQLLFSLEPLPCASSLKLPRPAHVVYGRYGQWVIEAGELRFALEDLVDDRILFPEFLKYLELRVSAENLRCLRAIQLFKESMQSPPSSSSAPSSPSSGPLSSLDCAWSIYKYFVAPGSAYGISISHRKLKEVMRALASPQIDTFDAVEQSALSVLRTHFEAYKGTKEYAGLYKLVVARKDSGILASLVSSKEGRKGSSSSMRLSLSLPALIRNSCFPPI